MRRPAWAAAAAALACALTPPAAGAEDQVVLRDGRVVRVERAEVLPDRVRVQTITGNAADLPADLPAKAVGAHTFEVPRQEVQAVFPVPDLPGAARPHAERYGDISQRLTDQVRRDLQRSWSLPPSPTR